MRRRDGPAGRLYKSAGFREIPNVVAASPLQDKLLEAGLRRTIGEISVNLRPVNRRSIAVIKRGRSSKRQVQHPAGLREQLQLAG